MKVLAERDGRAYDAAEVEDGPEYAYELALLVLGRVREHQRALGCP